MIDTFQNVFGLPESSVKLVGTVEFFMLFASFLNLSRLGSIATFGVLSVAVTNTLKSDMVKKALNTL